MTRAAPRGLDERLRDTRARLENEVDLWVATSDPAGSVHLIPLSYLWDGSAFVISTLRASVTSRNLLATGRVRLGVGPTRDVVLVDGTAEPADDPAIADAFAAKTGFDPREEDEPYLFFLIRPRRIQVWREANELPGRDIMRDGRWLG